MTIPLGQHLHIISAAEFVASGLTIPTLSYNLCVYVYVCVCVCVFVCVNKIIKASEILLECLGPGIEQ